MGLETGWPDDTDFGMGVANEAGADGEPAIDVGFKADSFRAAAGSVNGAGVGAESVSQVGADAASLRAAGNSVRSEGIGQDAVGRVGVDAASVRGVGAGSVNGTDFGDEAVDEAVDEAGRDEVVRGGWVPGAALPDQLRGSRWVVAPRHVAVIAGVLLAGLLWGFWSLARAQPEPVPDARPGVGIVSGSPVARPGDQPGGQPASGGPGSPAQASSPQVVVVHVAGKVRRPGLVRTKPGARIADVVAAAGGALPGADVTGLNLARQVTDGEQILVDVPGGAPTDTSTSSPGPGSAPTAGPVDLNTATLAQLEGLPGVGPVLAQRILDWRTERGRFSSVDELQEVSGVGEKKFASLRPHVRV